MVTLTSDIIGSRMSETKKLDSPTPALTDENCDKLDEFLKRHYSENLNEVARPVILAELDCNIFPSLRANALRNGSTLEQYRQMLNRAGGVVEELFDGLHANKYQPKDDEKPRGFWYHQDFDPLRTQDLTRGIDIDKDHLLQAAAVYLGCPEICLNRLDWIFLDAIIFAELDAFGDYLLTTYGGLARIFAGRSQGKYFAYKLLFSALVFLVKFVIPPAFAYELGVNGHQTGAIIVVGVWALLIVWGLIGYPFRWRARQKAKKLLQQLIDLYGLLGSSTISPRKLKEKLDNAANAGVVLDGAVFSIVDRIIARDATAFLPSRLG